MQKRRVLADASNVRTNVHEGTGTSGPSSSTASTRAQDDHPQSPSSKGASSRSAFLVGKGLFSWALAEQGDGESVIVGKVCCENADEEGEDDDDELDDEEDEDEERILEVNIRLKEAPSISRDQYFDRVRAFQTASTKSRADARKEGRKDKTKPAEGGEATSRSTTLSMSSPPSSSSPAASTTSAALEQIRKIASKTSTPAPLGGASAQQQLLHLLQALQAQGQSPRDAPKAQQAPASAAARIPAAAAAAATAATNQAQPLPPPPPSQDLMSQLLQTLIGANSTILPASASASQPPPQQQQRQQQQQQPPPSKAEIKRQRPAAAAHAASSTQLGTISLPARRQSLSTGPHRAASVSDAASPILGGLTPGYETGYVSGPSPAASTSASARPTKIETAPELSVKAAGSDKVKQCCYNCGLRAQTTWRIVMLSDEEVRFKEGSEHWHESTKFYRACNACGLYFNRYNGISRPEHVWKEAQRAPSTSSASSSSLPKKRVKGGSEEDGEESTTSPIDGEVDDDDDDDEDDESTEELLVAANNDSTNSNKKSFSRTLSEACHRDSERLLTSGDGETPAIRAARRKQVEAVKATSWDKARLKDFVMDSDGNWRTKRSVKENPGGRRPGRPKGSKTGKGQGRTRNQIYAERRARQQALMEANEAAAGQHSQPPPQSAAAAQQASSSLSSRPPLLPQKRATFAAQSSPVRPSKAARTASASGNLPFAAGTGLTPGTSPGHRSRYGAAGYLLDSSPATAFQTVMSEAETDWNSLYRILGQTPRRSPRKNPHGTMGGLNPYASAINQAPASPSSGRGSNKESLMDQNNGVAPLDLMAMMSSSPLTRGRVRSGQFTLGDPSLWTSSDGLQAGGKSNGNGSSSITSPGSPSPSPARLYSKLINKGKALGVGGTASSSSAASKNGRQLTAGNMATGDMQLQAGWQSASSPSKARKAARQARNAPSGNSNAQQQQQQQQRDLSKSDSVLDAGPFMGLSVFETEDDDGFHNFIEGNASPTLGRSLRRKNHHSSSKVTMPDLELPPPSSSSRTSASVEFDFGSSSGNNDGHGDAAAASSLTEAVSSGAASVKVEGKSSSAMHHHNDEFDFTDWTQSSSMRELFPTPSPVKGWSSGAMASQQTEDARVKGEEADTADPATSLWVDSPSSTAAANIASAAAAAAAAVAPDPELPATAAAKAITVTSEPAPFSNSSQDDEIKSSDSKSGSNTIAAAEEQNSAADSSNSGEPLPQDQQHLQIIRHRKPLPATVEDASPSNSSVIGANDDPIFGSDDEGDEDEEDGSEEEEGEGDPATTLQKLMEMFEDPYGLLAASGIGGANRIELQGPNGETSTVVGAPAPSSSADASSAPQTAITTVTQGNQTSTVPSVPEVSFDHLEAIELFQSMDFAKQFDFFTQAGSTGIAAHHVVEPATSAEETSGANRIADK